MTITHIPLISRCAQDTGTLISQMSRSQPVPWQALHNVQQDLDRYLFERFIDGLEHSYLSRRLDDIQYYCECSWFEDCTCEERWSSR